MLLDVVAEAGLDRGMAESLLKGNEGMEALREANELSRGYHVDSVPFFIVNCQFTLSGAQMTNVFLNAFNQATNSN